MLGQHTVFYAWQSDRDETVCRYLIRDAAKKAVKRIARGRIQSAPSLDYDTKNITGTPHIADTIQKKIRRCGVFVADVTFVSSYKTANKRTKKTPNPNVMIELGLAIRAVGWERILLVMNTAYGDTDHLPFDLKHHSFPLQYHLTPDGDHKTVFNDLTDRLYQKLNPIFDSGTIEAAIKKSALMSARIHLSVDKSMRLLRVDVVNKLVSLNTVNVFLEFGGPKPFKFGFVGQKPEPFAAHNSGQFYLRNPDPHQPYEPLSGKAPNATVIVVKSGVREILRIPATEWMTELESFRNPDPKLPARLRPVYSMARKPLGW